MKDTNTALLKIAAAGMLTAAALMLVSRPDAQITCEFVVLGVIVFSLSLAIIALSGEMK